MGDDTGCANEPSPRRRQLTAATRSTLDRNNGRGFKMARRSPRQMDLPVPKSWGGARVGAGRKPVPGRPRIGHDRRATHDARHPVLLTLRAAPGVPSLRSIALFAAVREAIARTDDAAFRVLHFSVQQDHVHGIVEGDDHKSLKCGILGLVTRIALAVKRVARANRVWGDRYHARALRTPSEVRNAICYVLLNFRKHLRAPASIDPLSSGPWFDGWKRPAPPRGDPSPTSAAQTWLASVGWRRRGLIDVHEGPSPARTLLR
jgi:putative transposase